MMLANFVKKLKGRIALTSNIWTSPSQMGYIYVIVEYINENFLLYKEIICFKLILTPHHTSTVTFYIINTCSEFMIFNKRF